GGSKSGFPGFRFVFLVRNLKFVAKYLIQDTALLNLIVLSQCLIDFFPEPRQFIEKLRSGIHATSIKYVPPRVYRQSNFDPVASLFHLLNKITARKNVGQRLA